MEAKTADFECYLKTWSTLVKEYQKDIQLRKVITHNKLIVIKRFQEDETWDLSRNMFENEIKAYTLLKNNPYVGKLYDTLRCEKAGDMMILEYHGEISAKDYIQKLNVPSFLRFFQLLTAAVESFEELQINHGDFHLENVMIVDNDIKVFDFGLAKGSHFLPSLWGGNIVVTRTSESQERYILGQDLHDFIVLYFIFRTNILPLLDFKDDLIDRLNLISEDEYNQLHIDPDLEDNYTEIQHRERKLYIAAELQRDHPQTSGKELCIFLQKQIDRIVKM